MTTGMQPECRTLSEAELDLVNGGTSGMMHAVAAAAYKQYSESNVVTFGTELSGILNMNK